jgi:eukaryotic-like serine/threonine-protein kinase
VPHWPSAWKSAPLPISLALEFIDGVLSALECAHAHGVVHRDVTPENIIVTTKGDVKLTGFGLSKTLSDPQLTQAGTVLGSLHYMSPEQVNGLPTLDARTDIYAVGAILYEMVTGRKPFPGRSQFDVMFAHANSTPDPPQKLNPEVPREVNELIPAALARDPSQRPQTAAEFREQVATIMQPASLSPKPARVPVPPARQEVPVALVATPATHLTSEWTSSAAVLAGVFIFAVAMILFFAIVRIR